MGTHAGTYWTWGCHQDAQQCTDSAWCPVCICVSGVWSGGTLESTPCCLTLTASASAADSGNCMRTWQMPATPCTAPRYLQGTRIVRLHNMRSASSYSRPPSCVLGVMPLIHKRTLATPMFVPTAQHFSNDRLHQLDVNGARHQGIHKHDAVQKASSPAQMATSEQCSHRAAGGDHINHTHP